ncbi:MAG TPA: protein kinase [Aggregatilineaceae bacterium]|nr:protein kinase [Aggregatilineaceae bacterium]
MTDWIGRTLSKVTVQRLLGRGGMAEVYLGLHTTLNRPVAVKVLYGHLLEDDTSMARFRSEAQSVASMRHPNIVQVYDFDVADDQPYIVMELLEGPSLADTIGVLHRTDQRLSPETIARLITAVAAALDYAHSRGVIHRDVKPSNVLLRREGGVVEPKVPLPDDVQPVLTDFGVARMANATIRTASGSIVGTPAYMSPEQVTGVNIDARSDIYSLGVMLYEMLSGRLPFGNDSDSVASVLIRHITEPPAPLAEETPAVQAVVFRALAKDPNDRYQSAGELALDLRRALGLPLTPIEMAAITPSPHAQTAAGPAAKKQASRVRPSKTSLTVGVLALLLMVGALAVLLGTGVIGSKEDQGTPISGAAGQGSDQPNFGVLSFESQSAEIDQAVLRVTHPQLPQPGTQYEVWLLGGEARRSIGVLDLDAEGNGQLVYVDSTGENLLTTTDSFEITIEPSPDTNPLPSGDVAYSGTLPAEPLAHIRHLLVSFSQAPGGIGLTIGMMRDANLITETSQAILEAQKSGDLAAMKREAEGLVNLIEGEGGADFGDLDSDGVITNPSDGFGLLPGSRGGGYIQSSIEHATYAASSPGATPYMVDQADKLETAAQNLGGWAAQIRDTGLAIIASQTVDDAADPVHRVIRLADLFVNGLDLNADGQIEPIAGEGGAQTMYFYARRMADIFVVSGPIQSPETGTANRAPHMSYHSPG